jgi:hypothetical protein
MTKLRGLERRDALAMVLSAAWHALRSYEFGNSAPQLAKEVCKRIESTAAMLCIPLKGINDLEEERDGHRHSSSPP